MAKAKAKKAASAGGGALDVLRPLIGDAIVTALWVLSSSFLGEVAAWLDPQLPALGGEYVLGLVLLLALLLAFSPICGLFWGAIFNPVNNLALVVSGKGQPLVNVLRMGAQVAGALAGSYAAKQLVPSEWQGKFQYNAGGLKEGILLEHGFACEVVLGLMASLLFLWSTDMTNKAMAFWVPLLATALWCHLGSSFTGPSMNPGIALSWNWHYQTHSPREHLVVFWLGPFTGAAIAGLVYRWLTRHSRPAASKKQRKQAASKTATAVAPAAAAPAAPAAPQAAAAAPAATAAAAAAPRAAAAKQQRKAPVQAPAAPRAAEAAIAAASSADNNSRAVKRKGKASGQAGGSNGALEAGRKAPVVLSEEDEYLRAMMAAAVQAKEVAKAAIKRGGPALAGTTTLYGSTAAAAEAPRQQQANGQEAAAAGGKQASAAGKGGAAGKGKGKANGRA